MTPALREQFERLALRLAELDAILAVDDGDSILMAQKLATTLGIGVGISSGANFLAALQAQDALGADAVVVTVFADDNKKYLSTDLLRDEPVRAGFMSPEVTLVSVRALRRVCLTCRYPDAAPTPWDLAASR